MRRLVLAALSVAVCAGATASASTPACAAATLPTWSGSIKYGGTTYKYTMIGQSPFAATTEPTAVDYDLFALKLTFADGTVLDPVKPACGDTVPVVTRVLQSPLFAAYPFTSNGTSVGETQYLDAFARANFWSSLGNNQHPLGYHVYLTDGLDAPAMSVALTVPKADGHTTSGPCAKIGYAERKWLEKALEGLGVLRTDRLTIFLLYNVKVALTKGTDNGYHAAVGTPPATYAEAGYFDHGVNANSVEDTDTLSHEIGEWMNDPFVDNLAPKWQNPIKTKQCSGHLEVGDPLQGVVFSAPLNGFTYHLQDLAFYSWFFRQAPSLGVGGLYSFAGTLKAPAANCPATGAAGAQFR